MAAKVEGNITGLKSSEVKAITNLGKRKYIDPKGYSNEQAHELCAVSRLINRQVGIIIDRDGIVLMVIVGTNAGLYIPELPQRVSTNAKFRACRLLHTHLDMSYLSQEDLMDMLFLRLDAMQVITVNPFGAPVEMQYAHLLPESIDNLPYKVYKPEAWDKFSIDIVDNSINLEAELVRISKDSVDI